MKRFGSGVDWRRAFITTAVNGYYDAFIRWQFNTLRKKGRVLFGKRNNVYSILDGQVCADHDRSEGEGVGPQEYVLIKLRVLAPDHGQERHGKMEALLKKAEDEGRKGVYLVPATLRPETMYGQTNCFVLPDGEYGAYVIDATNEVFVMSSRSARGLSCQAYDPANDVYFTKEFGKITCMETFTGDELLGLPLKAPNATYEKVYTLPLLTISMGKGTGVVTSVPSDAPDDYVALKMLKDKPDFAAKYGITPDMVDPFEVVPIISIEGYGDASAVFMCEKLKITTPNDRAKLAQAKDETYLKGFTLGVMTVGPHAGKKVSEAKPLIKEEMIMAGQAHLYFEPESKVVSRTNDECVVASTDQWYLSYGEESWCSAVKKHVLDAEKFNAYDSISLEKYDATLDWLKEWACTRQFGLGTFLPWDQQWVIESLSDSTIYMAYYTISKYLQGVDNLNGEESKSPCNIKVEDLTDEVFDYIYRKGCPLPEGSAIPAETLTKMRDEFRYWYPMDLRVSAKDLIPNHLTMALYNHAAVWDDEPELWPRGYYTNGHIMVDAAKMSKSKGNFLMMLETIENYSADATRFACADAGDTLDDANFSRDTANAAIVSLSNEAAWIKEILVDTDASTLRSGSEDMNFIDKVLDNETNRLVQATEDCFERMLFREGLQKGWFEMMIAKNQYKSWCQDSGVAIHEGVVRKWAESLIILICPICPHWSETLWKDIGKTGLAVKAPWPTVGEEDKLLTRQAKFLRDSLKNFRTAAGKAKKGWKTATILVAEDYPEWKVNALLWMQSQYDNTAGSFPSTVMKDLKMWTNENVSNKKQKGLTMQFVSFVMGEVREVGEVAMDIKCPFDQFAILGESLDYIKSQLGLEELGVGRVDDQELSVPERTSQNVTPGKPVLWMR
jgi:leucyl-tRNA synthetase